MSVYSARSFLDWPVMMERCAAIILLRMPVLGSKLIDAHGAAARWVMSRTNRSTSPAGVVGSWSLAGAAGPARRNSWWLATSRGRSTTAAGAAPMAASAAARVAASGVVNSACSASPAATARAAEAAHAAYPPPANSGGMARWGV